MSRQILLLAFLVALSGCASRIHCPLVATERPTALFSFSVRCPDLIPVPCTYDSETEGCECCRTTIVDGEKKLLFAVKNQGDADAGATTTKFRIVNRGTVTTVLAPTPELPQGLSVDLYPVTIPGDCDLHSTVSDCGVTVTVDHYDDEAETNEGNNSYQCITIVE